ncbi:hypothetical protein GL258_08245 [Macrococcoides canis]|nr:hypothetical protein GL258_08245 [Macrococcus canis]
MSNKDKFIVDIENKVLFVAVSSDSKRSASKHFIQHLNPKGYTTIVIDKEKADLITNSNCGGKDIDIKSLLRGDVDESE